MLIMGLLVPIVFLMAQFSRKGIGAIRNGILVRMAFRFRRKILGIFGDISSLDHLSNGFYLFFYFKDVTSGLKLQVKKDL